MRVVLCAKKKLLENPQKCKESPEMNHSVLTFSHILLLYRPFAVTAALFRIAILLLLFCAVRRLVDDTVFVDKIFSSLLLECCAALLCSGIDDLVF